jgi:membrane-associated protease RseP (regulator of RpoE activity)
MEPARVVRGLVSGSAAARAGLRNGDAIVKPVPQDAVQESQTATLTFLIKRGDKEFAITYLPRGEIVPAYQWKRVPGVPEATCRVW